MRRGALFVLDEPTAHLDAIAELEVFRSFLEPTAGLTSLMISHRFSNVRVYSRMFEAQAGGYR